MWILGIFLLHFSLKYFQAAKTVIAYDYHEGSPIDIGEPKETYQENDPQRIIRIMKRMKKRRRMMANIGLTEQKFRTLCLTVLWQCKDFYKKPENMAAFEKWKAEHRTNRPMQRNNISSEEKEA